MNMVVCTALQLPIAVRVTEEQAGGICQLQEKAEI